MKTAQDESKHVAILCRVVSTVVKSPHFDFLQVIYVAYKILFLYEVFSFMCHVLYGVICQLCVCCAVQYDMSVVCVLCCTV